MSNRIPPALTPSEWVAMRSIDGLSAHIATVAPSHHPEDSRPFTQAERLRALAAFALDGDPLGFTHDDAAMLRDVACCPAHVALCGSLADRLEALLAPKSA